MKRLEELWTEIRLGIPPKSSFEIDVEKTNVKFTQILDGIKKLNESLGKN
ncbi:MAG: hypothetical protein PVH88_11550 [Ignavibacteria bacterium]